MKGGMPPCVSDRQGPVVGTAQRRCRVRKLTTLIQRDVDAINAEACWTADQRQLFDLLLQDRLNDAGIMMAMNICSREKYYRIKKEVYGKLDRIKAEQ